MTDGFLSFDEAKQRLRDATRIILDAEKAYEQAAERAADAEAVYRNELAAAFKRYRGEGSAVAEADISARAEVAVHSRERDVSRDLVRLAGEKLEDARDSRRSLWRLIEWSMRGTTAAPMRDERVPAEKWPT